MSSDSAATYNSDNFDGSGIEVKSRFWGIVIIVLLILAVIAAIVISIMFGKKKEAEREQQNQPNTYML